MATSKVLIDSMLNCDGTRKNCEKCVFKEHPNCRNAMAHHAGALIQMQDVVIENSGALQRKVLIERESLKNRAENAEKQLKKCMDEFKAVLDKLREIRHCETCEASADGFSETEREERCKVCKELSLWTLDEKIVNPPVDPCDACDPDDYEQCEGCEHNPERRSEDGVKRID